MLVSKTCMSKHKLLHSHSEAAISSLGHP